MVYKNLIISPSNVSNQPSVKQSQFYKGFSTVDPTTLTTKIFDFNLIIQDILNIFQTKQGERVMNPTFGTIIWSMIFEPFTDDNKRLISEDVTRILNYDPRVTPTEINISEAEYGIIIEATLYYKQLDLSQRLIFNFNSEVGLILTQ